LLFDIFLCFSQTSHARKQFSLKSPDGKPEANITVGNAVEYSVSHNGDLMPAKSLISMTLADGNSYGVNPMISGASTRAVNQTIETVVYKRNKIEDNYNELKTIYPNDRSDK
jgi:alpha-glucosidase